MESQPGNCSRAASAAARQPARRVPSSNHCRITAARTSGWLLSGPASPTAAPGTAYVAPSGLPAGLTPSPPAIPPAGLTPSPPAIPPASLPAKPNASTAPVPFRTTTGMPRASDSVTTSPKDSARDTSRLRSARFHSSAKAFPASWPVTRTLPSSPKEAIDPRTCAA